MTNRKNTTKNKKRLIILSAALVILVVALSIILYKYHYASTVKPITASQTTKGESNGTSASAQNNETTSGNVPSSNSTTQPSSINNSATSTTTSSVKLITPNGDFVSAHDVSLNDPITSVCNTTPGASCQINFTNGDITKSLQSQIADSGGAVYWNRWTAQSIGITAGTWTIQAVSKLNTQTETANDATLLEVSQ